MAAYTNNSDYNNGLGVSSLYFLGDTSSFLTTNGYQTIENKTIDFSKNTILNAGSGGGGGGSGDTIAPATHGSNLIPKWGATNSKTLVAGVAAPNGIIVGTYDNQTLTNKSIDYNLNQIVNLPIYNDTTIFTNTSNLDFRTSNLENLIITFDPRLDSLEAADNLLDDRIDTNTDDITTIDLRVDGIEPQLVTLDNKIDNIDTILISHSNLISTNTSNITTLTSRINNNDNDILTLDNRIDTLESDYIILDQRLDTNDTNISTIETDISTNTTNIANNTTNIATKVIGPANNTDNYIPQWSGIDSKTLKDGLVAPNSTIVGISDNQTITNKTIDFNLNTILNATGGTGSSPNASNVLTINSNLIVDITNISNVYSCRVKLSASTNPVNNGGAYVIIPFNTLIYDLNSNFNTTTYKYTIQKSGYYKVTVKVLLLSGISSGIQLQKNSSVVVVQKNAIDDINICETFYFDASDTIGVFVSSTTNGYQVLDTNDRTVFQIELMNVSTPTSIPITTTVNYNDFTYTGDGNVMTGQINSNNYIPYWSSNNSTYLTNGIDLTTVSRYKTTSTISTAYTAIDKDEVIVDTAAASGNVIVTLPLSPIIGSSIRIILITQHSTRVCTVARNGSTIDGFSTTEIETYYTLWRNGDNITFKYLGGSTGWVAIDKNITPRFIFRGYLTTATVNTVTPLGTKIQVETINFDYNNNWDATNKRWVCPFAGIWEISISVNFIVVTTGRYFNAICYKNGTTSLFATTNHSASTADLQLTCTGTAQLVQGDYIELYYAHNSTTSTRINSGTSGTWFSVLNISR